MNKDNERLPDWFLEASYMLNLLQDGASSTVALPLSSASTNAENAGHGELSNALDGVATATEILNDALSDLEDQLDDVLGALKEEQG